MKLSRRTILRLAAGAAAFPAIPQIALGQAYPSRPVRVVVGNAPGGQIDLIARLIGQYLSERLHQPFIIDNRPGAAGNIATEAVVRAPADGHTLLMAFGGSAINATMFDKLNYDFIRDIAPVAIVNRIPLVLVVHVSFPAKTVPELIANAKANPGKLDLGSPGNGTAPHMAGELFKMMAGVDMVHVPYRGSPPMLTDLISGQVQVAFDGMSTSIEHVKAGRLGALAVTTSAPTAALPNVPTVGDVLPGFEASGFAGICAPKSTSAEIIEKLNGEINAALVDPKIKARLDDLGVTVLAGSPADFGKLIADETAKWAKVIRTANIRPE
jgi:tripartite-type tricarboxylate transporter receptor subunit TctC